MQEGNFTHTSSQDHKTITALRMLMCGVLSGPHVVLCEQDARNRRCWVIGKQRELLQL